MALYSVFININLILLQSRKNYDIMPYKGEIDSNFFGGGEDVL